MKASLPVFLLLLVSTSVFTQSKDESNLLKLSATIFRWEVQRKSDSLETTLADRLVVLNSAGKQSTMHLTYLEVFTRLSSATAWDLVGTACQRNTG